MLVHRPSGQSGSHFCTAMYPGAHKERASALGQPCLRSGKASNKVATGLSYPKKTME